MSNCPESSKALDRLKMGDASSSRMTRSVVCAFSSETEIQYYTEISDTHLGQFLEVAIPRPNFWKNWFEKALESGMVWPFKCRSFMKSWYIMHGIWYKQMRVSWFFTWLYFRPTFFWYTKTKTTCRVHSSSRQIQGGPSIPTFLKLNISPIFLKNSNFQFFRRTLRTSKQFFSAKSVI